MSLQRGKCLHLDPGKYLRISRIYYGSFSAFMGQYTKVTVLPCRRGAKYVDKIFFSTFSGHVRD